MTNFIKMLWLNKMMMDQVTDGGGGGGGTQDPPSKPPESETPPNNPPPEEGGEEFDKFGYKKTETKSEKEGQKKEGEESEEPSSTGYGEEPPKEEEDPEKKKEESNDPSPTGYGEEPPKPNEEPPKEDPPKEGDDNGEKFEISDPGKLTEDEVKGLKDFIDQNKLPKKVAQALVDREKARIEADEKAVEEYQREQQKRVHEQKVQWHDELKNDPDFGGDKFQHNLKQVDKALGDFFPSVKKELTKSKAMLAPYVMRDLAKLAEKLYSGTGPLVEGDPVNDEESKNKKGQKKGNDPLAFYKGGE